MPLSPQDLALPLLNGWTVGSALERLDEKNGWERCALEGNCLYRLGDKACPVGAFVADDAPYLKDLLDQGDSVQFLNEELWHQMSVDMPLTLLGCKDLQNQHDNADARPGTWNREWAEGFLVRHSLSMFPLLPFAP
jgi:hypothetical protein